jgi:hypothetical protein
MREQVPSPGFNQRAEGRLASARRAFEVLPFDRN